MLLSLSESQLRSQWCRRWRGVPPSRCLDRNHHRRTRLEKADCRIGTLRRLIGVEPEIIQCAPANRVGVLILSQTFPCSMLWNREPE